MARILKTFIFMTFYFTLPQPVWAQALLEDPYQDSYQSGVGLIRGWACQANVIEIQIDNGPRMRAAYGTTRIDTRSVCGDDNNGFGFTWNWNLTGDGTHRIRAYVDGSLFGDVTFHVATLGEEFLRGALGNFTLKNFPRQGEDTVIRWQESGQSFVIERTLPTSLDISLIYDIGTGVPPDQVDIIKMGFAIGQPYIDGNLGGGIPEAVRRNITAKIVATGRGNEEPGGGGACCTAFAISSTGDSMIRPFFDVAHPHWNQEGRPVVLGFWTVTAGDHKGVIHEYTHGWQHYLGCISIFSQPLGFWLNEGIAEYVAYEAMIKRGDMDRADVMDHMLFSARVTGQLDRPLRDFEGNSSGIWPGHVGYLAVDRLVQAAPKGLLAVRTICEQVADGATVPTAFNTAFGISLDGFYADFETWRQGLISK